jgi:predicted amidohydrolase
LQKVVLGLVQMAVSRDREENLAKAEEMVGKAARDGAQIVCLPELFETPYFPRTRRSPERPAKIPNGTTDRLSSLARENRIVLVGGSVYELSGGKTYNTCLVFDDNGAVLGKYRKIHIPDDTGFYEKYYFSPGNTYRVVKTRLARLGLLICFDQWYPEAARINRLMGAQIIFYPTAIGTVRGISETEGSWREAWEAVQRGHAVANGVVVASVNRVGIEGTTDFWGGSFVCDQFGKVLARADSKERVVLAKVDLELGREVEAGWGFLRNRKPATYQRLVS